MAAVGWIKQGYVHTSSSSSSSYVTFQNTVITKNKHNRTATKSHDQQSCMLPIITIQIRYEQYNKQKQNLKLNVRRMVQEVQLVQCQLRKSIIIIM